MLAFYNDGRGEVASEGRLSVRGENVDDCLHVNYKITNRTVKISLKSQL